MRAKNFFLTLLLTAMISVPAHLGAQVTIGGTNVPHEFSILELMSNDERGLRLPQLTTDQRNDMQATFGALAQTEAKGLQIFNIDTRCVETWSGTRWISRCSCIRGSVEINGVCWARSNVYMPGMFAQNPEDAGMYYQWNRRRAWPPAGGGDWDTSIPTGTEWYEANDPCPPGWRVPTEAEIRSLHSAVSTWEINWNDTGIDGRLFGVYPNQIFVPASGSRHYNTGVLGAFGTGGTFWSSSSTNYINALRFWFGSGSVLVSSAHKSHGFPVRCVAD